MPCKLSTTAPSIPHPLSLFSPRPSTTPHPSLPILPCLPQSLTKSSSSSSGSPFYLHKLQRETSSSSFKTTSSFSESFEGPPPTLQALESVSLAAPSCKLFTTLSCSPATASSPQQTLKTSVSTFTLQKQGYSNKTLATSMTLAGGKVPLSPPSKQIHQAPTLPPLHILMPQFPSSTTAA